MFREAIPYHDRRKLTVFLLQRRHVVDGMRFIGKQSNRLEEVEEGVLADPASAYVEYADSRRDEWATKVLPILGLRPYPSYGG